jgi:hypothetical protein
MFSDPPSYYSLGAFFTYFSFLPMFLKFLQDISLFGVTFFFCYFFFCFFSSFLDTTLGYDLALEMVLSSGFSDCFGALFDSKSSSDEPLLQILIRDRPTNPGSLRADLSSSGINSGAYMLAMSVLSTLGGGF